MNKIIFHEKLLNDFFFFFSIGNENNLYFRKPQQLSENQQFHN